MKQHRIALPGLPEILSSAACAIVLLGLGVACAAQKGGESAAAASPSAAPMPGAPAPEQTPAPRAVPASAASPAAATPAGAGANAKAQSDDPVLVRGRELFAKYCTICHGDQGDGAGKFAYLMNPRPRNLLQGNFKLATTENQIPSDEDLMRTISNGMPGSAMPPWGHLPRTDLQALVRVVREFHVNGTERTLGGWVAEGTVKDAELPQLLAGKTQPGPPLVTPPEPAFDEIRWFHGRKLYLEGCASCHGADGQPVAAAVKFDAEGYPVPPRSFVNGIFKGGSDGHQLYSRIWKGIKGTPMPASEGVYSSDGVWDLIHYVQTLARSGAQQRAQLRQGTFVAPNIRRPLPAGPMDTAWEQARPLYVALTPLWWTEGRVEGLVVQAVHNDEDLALRLSWIDPTEDESAVRQTEFRDAVAIQFSLSSDPPFYMGSAGDQGGVNIWMWKADRQKNLASGYQDVDAAFPGRAVDYYPEQGYPKADSDDVEWKPSLVTEHDPQFITAWGAGNLVADPRLSTPVECLVARGPGTLAGKPAEAQIVQGSAVYERGVWYVQLQRRLDFGGDPHHAAGDERMFRPGDYLPVSFAIWNGSAGDRDGKKNISIWQKLVIE